MTIRAEIVKKYKELTSSPWEHEGTLFSYSTAQLSNGNTLVVGRQYGWMRPLVQIYSAAKIAEEKKMNRHLSARFSLAKILKTN